MILARATGCALAAAITFGAAPAHADVMELGPEGARWVSGPLAGQSPVPAARAAVAALEQGPAVPDFAIADPARHARAIPPRYAAKVAELAARFDLSPALMEAVVWQESRWNANARSPVGAQGLAQLMPGTARYLGVDPKDPFANLEGGARYLREQLDRFDGNIEKALAAYNAGPGRVERAGGVPAIRETQGYVSAIIGRLSAHARASGQ
ncbi:MAG: lytic transglycosylase domain-containing protein [Erythrobacter sp.]